MSSPLTGPPLLGSSTLMSLSCRLTILGTISSAKDESIRDPFPYATRVVNAPFLKVVTHLPSQSQAGRNSSEHSLPAQCLPAQAGTIKLGRVSTAGWNTAH